MDALIKAGSTSQLIRFYLLDASSVVQAALKNIGYNTTGLKCNFIRDDQTTSTTITLVNGTLGTWVSGGFSQVDSTNFPGLYELGLPDSALASSKSVKLLIFGALSLAPRFIDIELTAVDFQSATSFITSIGGQTPPTNWNKLNIDSTTGGVITKTNNDKSGYALTTAEHTLNQSDVVSGMANQGLTTIRVNKLDYLDVNVSTRLAASSYTSPNNSDSSGVTTLLALITPTRAGYLDKLNINGNVASYLDVSGEFGSADRTKLNAIAADYQQRGNAVILPTLPTVTLTDGSFTYSKYASDNRPPTNWSNMLINPSGGVAVYTNLNPSVTPVVLSTGAINSSTFASGTVLPKVDSVKNSVQIDLTQQVPYTNDPNSVGDSLNVARAQGFGNWKMIGNTLYMYAPDTNTVVHSFNFDSTTAPTKRDSV